MTNVAWNRVWKKLWAKKNRVYTILALIFLVFLAWQIIGRITGGRRSEGGQRGGVSVAVEVSAIERGGIRDVGVFSGTLIPKSYFTIVPKISGRLKELYVDIGDRIARGQLVAVIEDEEYQQQVIQAEADLGVAKANLEEAASALELAKREFERAKALHEKRILSVSELEAAVSTFGTREARHKVTLAQLANQQAALETAKVRLSYTRIRAAWDKGESRYVGERFVNEGTMLSSNTSILSIIELQPMTAVVYVTEKDYFRLKLNQPVALTSGAFPGTVFKGRVVRIAPLLKETSREARIEIEVENPDSILKPGMFINVRIEFASRQDTTIVPVSALVTRTGRQGVFLADIEQKKAVFLPVTVGIVEGERAEILEPAKVEGSVVTLGHHLLENGTTIILPGSAPGEKAEPRKKGGTAPSKKPGDKR